MSDGITDYYRRIENEEKILNAVDTLADLLWQWAKNRPSGECRESFITDICESITNRIAERIEARGKRQ